MDIKQIEKLKLKSERRKLNIAIRILRDQRRGSLRQSYVILSRLDEIRELLNK